ncbi:hypothetical protein NDU88_002859 [Pleurodeles waltl]|uniref:Uncharacterized protein n=1 Tax=Pleurodeles waltl TaxID=8319 RepID=A0AAV7VDT0_PLEWA|nr:hypothetical protein NDU88_002859 [Pleurodeles waltl]
MFLGCRRRGSCLSQGFREEQLSRWFTQVFVWWFVPWHHQMMGTGGVGVLSERELLDERQRGLVVGGWTFLTTLGGSLPWSPRAIASLNLCVRECGSSRAQAPCSGAKEGAK